MVALTSNDYKKATINYLLSFDIENWKIFTDNYYKLTPFESERIMDVILEKIDFHMLLDLLTLSDILGQSIALSNDLISLFTNIDISPVEEQITIKIEELLISPAAEERRIGLLLAGYFDRSEFFSTIEKMSNYDILFEDAYFALGLMSDKKIVELLSTKFIYLSKNQIQREAIAKILAKKGNPLAALWLFKNKGLDESTSNTKTIYLSRELAWAGIQPHLFLDSNDDFLQPMTIKMINGLSVILPYDIDLINEVNLLALVEKLVELLEIKPTLELVKTLYSLKIALEEIYYNIDPYGITKITRKQIIDSWKMIKNFPNTEILDFIRSKVNENFSLQSKDFQLSLRLIRNFKLRDYEQDLIALINNEKLSIEKEFDIITTLGEIGSNESAIILIEKINTKIDFDKRSQLSDQFSQFHSEIDFYDDFDNEPLKTFSQSFEEIENWNDIEYDDSYYWNILYNLGKLEAKIALPTFLKALEDYDPKIRLEAVNGIRLLKIKTDEIEEKLISVVLNEKFISITREALITLGEINSSKSIQIFLKIIYEAFEDGTLEMVGEIEEDIYDDRWDSESDDYNRNQQNLEEVGATHRISTGIASANKKSHKDDFNKWLNKFNVSSSKNLELREDFVEKEIDLTLESEVIDDSEISDIINDQTENETDLSEEEDDEWFSELGERFKKLTMVESALESLKITEAQIPIDDIKDLMEQPIDSELYKDALIILAKRGDEFAINELQGYLDQSDYLRLREITNILINNSKKVSEKFITELKNTPDWILKDIFKKNLGN